jgi:hypothetical protein
MKRRLGHFFSHSLGNYGWRRFSRPGLTLADDRRTTRNQEGNRRGVERFALLRFRAFRHPEWGSLLVIIGWNPRGQGIVTAVTDKVLRGVYAALVLGCKMETPDREQGLQHDSGTH